MGKNLAQMHGPGNMIERDTGGEKLGFSMDRRVSVAPMMDWSDRHCLLLSCKLEFAVNVDSGFVGSQAYKLREP